MTHPVSNGASSDRLLDIQNGSNRSQLVDRPRFRADIEGLRAIAILMVVAYHAGVPGFSGGYVGVDVFFVISGYLITWLLVHEVEESGRIDFVCFYSRRAKRLLPALALMLATVSGLSVLYPAAERLGIVSTALRAATCRSNLYFSQTALDYLGTDLETNPLLHAWSLNVEEQFYLVWPLFIALLLGGFGKRPVVERPAVDKQIVKGQGRSPQETARKTLVLVLAAIAAISFAYAVRLTAIRQPSAFFLTPPRAWEFLIGAIGILVPFRAGRLAQSVLSWLGLSGILAASIGYDASTLFPGTAALLPAIATVLLLYAGAGSSPTALSKVLSLRLFQRLGKLSYSWYLWHWPLLIFGGLLVAEPLSLIARLGLVVGALLVAIASYQWVENPIRRSVWTPKKSMPLVAVTALIILGLSIAIAPPGATEVSFDRDDGGPPFSVLKPFAKVTYSFSDPGTVNVVSMDESGFCNTPKRQAQRHFDLVVVGDSSAWCTTVEPETTWTSQLAAPGRSTYNLSKPGIGPYEYLELLRRFGLAKSPQIAVMNLYEGNDLRDALAYKDYRRDPTVSPPQLESPLQTAKNFRYELVFDSNTVSFNSDNGDLDEMLYAELLASDKVSLTVFSEALEAFVALSRQFDFVPILTYTPSAYTAYKSSVVFEQPELAEVMRLYSQKQRRFFRQKAAALGLAFVDFTPSLQAAAEDYTAPEKLLYFPTNRHLTRYGHAAIAKMLASYLQKISSSLSNQRIR